MRDDAAWATRRLGTGAVGGARGGLGPRAAGLEDDALEQPGPVGTLLTEKMLATAENARYESPRGVIRGSHTVQSVYLARADATDFDVLQRVFTA